MKTKYVLRARKSRSENVAGKIVDIFVWFDGLGNYGRSAHVDKTHLFGSILILPFVRSPSAEGWRSVSGGMGRGVTAQHTMARPKNGEEELGGETEPIVVPAQCRATTSWRPPWPIVNSLLSNRLGRLLRACSSSFLLFYTPVAPFISPSPTHSLHRHHLSFFNVPCHDYYVVNRCVSSTSFLWFVKLIRRKPIIKERSRRLWSTVLILSPSFVRAVACGRTRATLGSVRSTKVARLDNNWQRIFQNALDSANLWWRHSQ